MQSYDSNCALDCSIWMAPNEKMSGEKRAVSSLPDRLCWTEVCSQIRLFFNGEIMKFLWIFFAAGVITTPSAIENAVAETILHQRLSLLLWKHYHW